MSQLDAAASPCVPPCFPIPHDGARVWSAGTSGQDPRAHRPSSSIPTHELPTAAGRVVEVLWIDDEPDHALSLLLQECGCQIEWTTTGAAGLERAAARRYDAIVVDVRLGDMSGLTVLRRLTTFESCPPLLVVTGCYCEDEVLQDACRFGARGVAYKPFLDEQALAAALRVVIDGHGHSPLLRVRPDDVRDVHHARHGRPAVLSARSGDRASLGIVAVSRAMREVVEWIAHAAPTESTILLTGETGVGKELVAEAVHRSSRRRDHPLVTLNCASIPDALFESELFGHRKGAFTGAVSDQPGVVERAHRGALFLDEIGDVPLAVQGHLLRFLETGEVRRLGDAKSARFDVRIIAATNRPVSEDVARGLFRQDLYFRLAVLHCHIPPLRERRDDLEAKTQR